MYVFKFLKKNFHHYINAPLKLIYNTRIVMINFVKIYSKLDWNQFFLVSFKKFCVLSFFNFILKKKKKIDLTFLLSSFERKRINGGFIERTIGSTGSSVACF